MKGATKRDKGVRGWELISVGDLFSFIRSYAFSRDALSNGILGEGRIGNIHYGDIHATFGASSINLEKIAVPRIKDGSFLPGPGTFLRDGDLVMADASEDYAGIGVSVSIHGVRDRKVVGGLHTFVLRDEGNKTDSYFRQYIFLNPEVRNSLQKIANGVSVYGISKTAVSKLRLLIPPLAEQKSIVAVLETWDKAIEKLKRKIEIKKEIKKGLMQELLTGKRRLPGFKGEWKFVRLGSVCEIKRGGSPRPIEDYITEDSDGLNWLRIGDVAVGERYIYKTSQKIKKEGLKKTALVNAGDFILSNSMSYGRPYIMKISACIHDGWLALGNISSSINPDFLYYILASSQVQAVFNAISAGSGVQNLKKESVSRVNLRIPHIDEQNLIAKVLVNTDDEILSLEKCMNIFLDQKKYLLNNLITGAIRTPETLSTPK